MERAGYQGPKAAAREVGVLEGTPGEGSSLVRDWWDIGQPVAVGLGLRTEYRGEEGRKGKGT